MLTVLSDHDTVNTRSPFLYLIHSLFSFFYFLCYLQYIRIPIGYEHLSPLYRD